MSGTIAAAVVGVGSLINSIDQKNQASSIANDQLGVMQSQNARQQTSYDQLQQLMADPSSFLSNPLFQSALAQGSKAVAVSQAGKGNLLGSGGMATALQQFGQGFAWENLLQQEQLLAGASGSQFNPAQAGQGAVAANQNATGTLAGLYASLGAQLSPQGPIGKLYGTVFGTPTPDAFMSGSSPTTFGA